MPKVLLSRLALFLLPLLLLGGTSCKKLAELLTFKVNDSSSFTIPATGLVAGTVLSIPGVTVGSTSQSTFKNNGTSADYVQDVTLTQLTLTTTNPSTQNFDFLKSVSIYIADANGNNKVLLASLNPVPTGQTTISLTPSGNKLDTYIKAGSYQLSTQAEVAKPLAQNTDVRVDSQFSVTAKLP